MSDNTVERRSVLIDFASLSKMLLGTVSDSSSMLKNKVVSNKYSKEDIRKYLNDPMLFSKELRNVSIGLYFSNSHYRRLVSYFSSMLTFDYICLPYEGGNLEKINIKTATTAYKKVLNLLEVMNLKHEMLKAVTVAIREDVFYGYEHMGKDSYFIQKMDADYCMISSIEDGIYNYAFDFSFFDRNPEKLEIFPSEFKSKYNAYLKDRTKMRWQELDSKNTVCFKVNEDFPFPVPVFGGTFEDLIDLQEFKQLRKAREKLGNYKFLVQKIPVRQDSTDNDDFAITLKSVMHFHNRIAQVLPDEIGILTSPMDIEPVSFDKDSATSSDAVAEAYTSYMRSAGVSESLFNSEKMGAVGLTFSIKADESMMFALLRQIERWVNKKIKTVGGKYRFKVIFPNLTIYNRDDEFEKYLKAAQFGFSRLLVAASLGMSPNDMVNMLTLEHDILGLDDKMIPLVSSHTQTNEGGRPEKKTEKLSGEGEKTRDNQKNPNRAK